MTDSHDDELPDDADEREQMTAAIVAGLFEEEDLKAFVAKTPFADAEALFTQLHQSVVDKIEKLSDEERIEFISDLLGELNWNYIVNTILNEAYEAGFYKEGETKLLENEGDGA